MRIITFNQLKHMDREELQDVLEKINQDKDPKYCTEPERIKFLNKLKSQVKFFLYNPVAKTI